MHKGGRSFSDRTQFDCIVSRWAVENPDPSLEIIEEVRVTRGRSERQVCSMRRFEGDTNDLLIDSVCLLFIVMMASFAQCHVRGIGANKQIVRHKIIYNYFLPTCKTWRVLSKNSK